jgi:hypothetical protein
MIDITYARRCSEIKALMDKIKSLRNTSREVCAYIDIDYGKNSELWPRGTPVIKTFTSEKTQSIQHYPILKNWRRKIVPHLDNPKLQAILAADFNKYTVGCWGQRFRPGQLPADFESCDWRLSVRGRHPKYFDYVKHGACHWLVNFNHHLAKLVEPNRTWRIITSDEHSTVWDNESTLFDLNGLALFDSAAECFEAAAFGPNSEVLAPAEGVIIGLPKVHYAREIIGLRIKPLYHLRVPAPVPMA